MAKTRKPSGLQIIRKKNVFIAGWKIADKDYGDGQNFQYRLGTGKWKNVNISKTRQKYSIPAIDKTKYFPTKGKKKLAKIRVRVRGNRKKYTSNNKTINPTMSDWSLKEFVLKKPAKPKVSVSVGTWPSTTFGWEVKVDDIGKNWFFQVVYQHVLVADTNAKTGKNISEAIWKTGTSGTSTSAKSSIRVVEDSSEFESGHSYTRFFRVKSQGVAGETDWVYGKHVYASSLEAVIVDDPAPVITRNNQKSGYTCQIWFDSPFFNSNPIDEIETQYQLATPDEHMEAPDSGWQTGIKSVPKDKTSSSIFSIDSLPNVNQCLFVRVNTTYDGRTTYGIPKLVDYGRLSLPEELNAATDPTNFTATIQANNTSSVPTSYLVVKFFSDANPDGIDIGIIKSGQEQTIVKCPPWTDESRISFGVYAAVSYTEPILDTDFVLTTDTTVILNKNYFERVGEGTSDNPYEYVDVEIEDPSVNPSEEGWYEASYNEVTRYIINPVMTSDVVREGGKIPISPSPDSVRATQTEIQGTIRVTWDWVWDEADAAEVSWANHPDAWESTDEPETYIVTKMKSSALNISGLETGIKWYIRVRLISGLGDEATWGAYSPIKVVNLASAPSIPVIQMSGNGVITEDGSVTISWGYSTTDGTAQAGAHIAEVVEVGGVDEYHWMASVTTEQQYTIIAKTAGWSAGETHRVAVLVVSASGQESDKWSDPVLITVAEPLECDIPETSLTERSEKLYEVNEKAESISSYNVDWDVLLTKLGAQQAIEGSAFVTITQIDTSTVEVSQVNVGVSGGTFVADTVNKEDFEEYGISDISINENAVAGDRIKMDISMTSSYFLERMPLTATVTGAGEGGRTTLIIERADEYFEDRPDETDFNGFDGETIVLAQQSGEDQFEIDLDSPSLVGKFNDTAVYQMYAIVQDELGQRSVFDPPIRFTVDWEHQALMPSGTVTIDNENLIARLTPIAPTEGEVLSTDVCDIYRLSVDKPELIYEGAEFGKTYVDPYPAIGQFGGHRFVFMTANGDYSIQDNSEGSSFAWFDTHEDENDRVDTAYNIIEFGEGRVLLDRNVDISNSWSKDFNETQYLGGSVQGDWNLAVRRTGSVSAVAITLIDQDQIEAMRRLATYTGICHVRTVDGSSYPADVQVSESYSHGTGKVIASFSLKITRVDQQELDGMTEKEWDDLHPEEEPTISGGTEGSLNL